MNLVKPAWRNGLARWTSNPKVVGSTPTVGVLFISLSRWEISYIMNFLMKYGSASFYF